MAVATKANSLDPVTQRPVQGQTQVIAGPSQESLGITGLPGFGPSPTRIMQGQQSKDPYRSGLQTSFQGGYDPGVTSYNDYSNDSDSDVRVAQALTNDLSRAHAGQNSGMDQVAGQAQLDAILARIGKKNALGSAIARNPELEGSAENDLRYSASHALSEGLKNTKQNYGSRGLLYSGLRQGGEASVRSNVAGNLAEGLADTKRNYANVAQQQKEAYAALGQQQEQMRLDRANETFDTVTKNNVARAQAMQQLGEGFGRVAGTFAGSQSRTTAATPGSQDRNDYRFMGTGSSDGYGGTQLAASNYDYGTTG